jgi:cysteine desulfurase
MSNYSKNQRIYLDWAASTPLRNEVFEVMLPHLKRTFANPSAIHLEGAQARQAIEQARTDLGKTLQVKPESITFTSGGTEANNLAISGYLETLVLAGKKPKELEVVTTRLEHPSVLETLERWNSKGVNIKYIEVNDTGKIKLDSLAELMTEKTVLVSLAYVNSEIGVIQPMHSVRKILSKAELNNQIKICLHVDGAQAPLWLSCQFDKVGADLLTLDAAKAGGPKGLGVLVKHSKVNLVSISGGGGQESGLRPGTENVAGIVGSALAFKLAQSERETVVEKITKVRDESINYIKLQLSKAILNGPTGTDRVANNINISLPGLDTEFATIVLDKHGFGVSTKSACAGAGGGESGVVREISGDSDRASSTLRITLGPDSEFSDVKQLVSILREHTEKMSLTS